MKAKIADLFNRIKEMPLITRVNTKLKDIPFLSRLPKKTGWIIASILLLAIAGGFTYYRLAYLPSQSADEPAMQTAVVRRGDLVIYASGTGTLVSADEADLAFKTGGQVTDILVEVGDEVQSGDLLAKVDDTDVQIAYTQAKRALAELTSASAIANAQTAMADAQTELTSAESHLAYILSPNVVYWEKEVAKAKQTLEEAQTAADNAPTDKNAQAALQKAKDRLNYIEDKLSGAWVSYKAFYLPNNFTVKPRDGDKYIAAPTDAEILAARADVATYEAALQEAEWLYAALTGGEVPEDATGSGLTELEQAKLDLEAAQADLDGTSLYAPFSGTIMSIDTSTGDTVSSGTTVITIDDLSRPYLEVYLDESDWSNIKVDDEVEVTFDILPDKTYTGTVTQVDPGLYTENNTSVVRALVKLGNIDIDNFNLPLGTTASVDVIGGRAQDAVLVPIEALHQAGDQYTVFVMENGKPRLRVIEIGIQDLLYAEVKSGLEPGDVVTTGITETQ